MAISRRTPLQEVGGETFEAGDGGAVERTPLTGLFEVRRRGRVTYYTQPGGIISSLVTVRDGMGDLTIHFAGLTGGTSVTNRDYLGPPGSRARAPAGRAARAPRGLGLQRRVDARAPAAGHGDDLARMSPQVF